jgi:hypothetical protein
MWRSVAHVAAVMTIRTVSLGWRSHCSGKQVQKLMNPGGISAAVRDLGIKAAFDGSIAGSSELSVKAPTGIWRSSRHPTTNQVTLTNTIAVQTSASTATLVFDGGYLMDQVFLTTCGHATDRTEEHFARNQHQPYPE